MRVLVVYGSKRQGTAGLAEMVADGFRREGVRAVVAPADAVRDLDLYDAVIVGGALYAGRWHKDARRFVKRLDRQLRARPVWFFSSGPLDGSAEDHEIPPTHQVAALMARIGARGHVTFGGRLAPDAHGFPASAMAKDHAGDWRDPTHAATWAREVAATLAPAVGDEGRAAA